MKINKKKDIQIFEEEEVEEEEGEEGEEGEDGVLFCLARIHFTATWYANF